MAGTTICKQQNHNTNNKLKTGSQQKTTNLNITLHTKPANICCCLWLQQQQQQTSIVATDTNSTATAKYCCWHKTTCRLDDRILTNYNCNIKSVKQQQKKPHQKRPLTLSIAVIIMSLSILLIHMPTMVASRAIYVDDDESLALSSALETSADYNIEESEALPIAEISSSSSSSSSDYLSYLDVIKHAQRNEEHRKERRKNLRKRSMNDWIISRFINSSNLEWENPCNVHSVDMSVPVQPIPRYHYYINLDQLLNHQTILLTNKISTNDMNQWKKHAERYVFLPKLNHKKHTVNLSRWYRNLQTFVGSFGYLARAQYKFDKRRQHESQISEELNELLKNARSILCGLESAINGSAPKNNEKKLKMISRDVMYSRFNFITHKIDGSMMPRILDMKFVKHYYINYVEQMKKNLGHKLEVMSKKYGFEYNSNQYANISDDVVGGVSGSLDYKYKSDEASSDIESFEQHFKTHAKQ